MQGLQGSSGSLPTGSPTRDASGLLSSGSPSNVSQKVMARAVTMEIEKQLANMRQSAAKLNVQLVSVRKSKEEMDLSLSSLNKWIRRGEVAKESILIDANTQDHEDLKRGSKQFVALEEILKGAQDESEWFRDLLRELSVTLEGHGEQCDATVQVDTDNVAVEKVEALRGRLEDVMVAQATLTQSLQHRVLNFEEKMNIDKKENRRSVKELSEGLEQQLARVSEHQEMKNREVDDQLASVQGQLRELQEDLSSQCSDMKATMDFLGGEASARFKAGVDETADDLSSLRNEISRALKMLSRVTQPGQEEEDDEEEDEDGFVDPDQDPNQSIRSSDPLGNEVIDTRKELRSLRQIARRCAGDFRKDVTALRDNIRAMRNTIEKRFNDAGEKIDKVNSEIQERLGTIDEEIKVSRTKLLSVQEEILRYLEAMKTVIQRQQESVRKDVDDASNQITIMTEERIDRFYEELQERLDKTGPETVERMNDLIRLMDDRIADKYAALEIAWTSRIEQLHEEAARKKQERPETREMGIQTNIEIVAPENTRVSPVPVRSPKPKPVTPISDTGLPPMDEAIRGMHQAAVPATPPRNSHAPASQHSMRKSSMDSGTISEFEFDEMHVQQGGGNAVADFGASPIQHDKRSVSSRSVYSDGISIPEEALNPVPKSPRGAGRIFRQAQDHQQLMKMFAEQAESTLKARGLGERQDKENRVEYI